jgi:aryl sulfotransferase
MTSDLASAVAAIADHVGIDLSPKVIGEIVRAASFGRMKANASRFAPAAGRDFWKTDANFFDSATSNKWLDQLTEADLRAYEIAISGLLGTKERSWLEWGSEKRASA